MHPLRAHPLLPHGCVPGLLRPTAAALVPVPVLLAVALAPALALAAAAVVAAAAAAAAAVAAVSCSGHAWYLVLSVRSTLRSNFQPAPGTSNLVPSVPAAAAPAAAAALRIGVPFLLARQHCCSRLLPPAVQIRSQVQNSRSFFTNPNPQQTTSQQMASQQMASHGLVASRSS
jgi:hypothetical protein